MGKRGQNEGSIHKRKDGYWVAVVNNGWKDGKRDRTYLYGATRSEVAAKLTEALNKQREGLPIAFERQTVGQFLDRWLTDVVKPSVRPKTHHSYAQLARLHLKPALGKHQLAKLTPQHVQQMMNDKLAAGLSPRTVQYLRAVLRRALGQALKWGLVARNVATLVDPPRSVHHEMRFLTPAQARALLDAAKRGPEPKEDRRGRRDPRPAESTRRLEALYTVALALGLRQGEALGLRWEDVDLEAGTLTIRNALQRIDGELRLVEPKTEGSRRALAMPPTIVAALRAHKVRQLEDRLVTGSRWQDRGFVFASAIGTPLDARNVVRHFKAVLARAGLPDMRWHDLRHTCATLLLAQGVPHRVVMEVLGHSQISLTMRYSHVVPELQREAADRMEALLAAGG